MCTEVTDTAEESPAKDTQKKPEKLMSQRLTKQQNR